ncbi:hypothetical protein HMF8227_02061 [Saliniradius amylolyticus]|uniref:BioF2-like acetyltransferase domain-containing protein n=1 Tax=Saliniradius amylolyticus TaxID=2183582 RepID=A0A2S2E4S5_9ALTE|nr:GNAT family N-acetyltransferase [Saliniradius amylolyticus]AWL12522.1 hypothetical protein HMF8227_02061 [Saliniradius amylolyticus]
MQRAVTATFVKSIADIPHWDRLTPKQPFLQHHFLFALEQSGCVGGDSGWQPHHMALYQDDELVGALPLYVKEHSYGEYVFDFAWADAYYRYGLDYYPKLVSAIPFTPVPGPRLLTSPSCDVKALWSVAERAILSECQHQDYSSFHLLFPESGHWPQDCSLLKRHNVQFHWFNRGYTDFDDFLAGFSSRKRKNLKKERQKLRAQEVNIERLTGSAITTQVMDDFIHCYRQTYLKRSGHSGYLNPAFFQRIRETMAEQMLIVRAEQRGRLLGSALLFFDQTHLYGRYWGALEPLDGLHFETCYYQGIEFCIKRGLKVFNPGTQGEHKIQRGFEPTQCYSGHRLVRPEFHQAVGDFIQQEHGHLNDYIREAATLLPFKKDG